MSLKNNNVVGVDLKKIRHFETTLRSNSSIDIEQSGHYTTNNCLKKSIRTKDTSKNAFDFSSTKMGYYR